MPPKNLKQQVDTGSDDYEPDTDGPDTSESDQMLSEGLNTESGIGHSKLLQRGEKYFADANAKLQKENEKAASEQKARADAAASMVR